MSLLVPQVRNIVAAHQCSNPLFLKTLLEELRIFGSFEELNKQIADYLKADSPSALFQKVFARLEADYQSQKAGVLTFNITFFHLTLLIHVTFSCKKKGIVCEVLSALWASRKGLSEQELSELLSIPQALLSPLLIALENCLVSLLFFFLSLFFVTIFGLINNSKLGFSIGPIDVLPWLHETGRLWSIFQNSRRSRESLQNTTCELLQIRIGTPPSLLRRSTSTPGSQFSLGRLETVSVVWVLCGRECCVCGCCECCVWVLRGYCCECCVWV